MTQQGLLAVLWDLATEAHGAGLAVDAVEEHVRHAYIVAAGVDIDVRVLEVLRQHRQFGLGLARLRELLLASGTRDPSGEERRVVPRGLYSAKAVAAAVGRLESEGDVERFTWAPARRRRGLPAEVVLWRAVAGPDSDLDAVRSPGDERTVTIVAERTVTVP